MGFYTGRPTSMAPAFRSKAFLIPLAAILILFMFIYSPLPSTYDDHRDAVLGDIAEAAKGHFLTPPPSPEKWQPETLETVDSKYAFATFLAGPGSEDVDANIENDHYFVATRILAYQLLHAPETRSRDKSIPFVVLVTDNVSEEKRSRLRKDGAVVVPAEFIRAEWVKTETSTWQDVMTKLRLWELTQFDRICFLDGDTILVEPIDGIFEDPSVMPHTTGQKKKQLFEDEAAMPANYSFAGVPEMNRQHHFPPVDGQGDFPNINYLNAGFFVFQPSLAMLDYYMSLMKTVDKFNPTFPEQNLLNYAHRKEGNMPWLQLGNTWNIHYPTVDDLLNGVKSMHDKWWAPENDELRPYMESWRWRMEGHMEALDAVREDKYGTDESVSELSEETEGDLQHASS